MVLLYPYIIFIYTGLLVCQKASCSFLASGNPGVGGVNKTSGKSQGANIIGNVNSMDTLLMTAKIISTAETIHRSIQNENNDQRLRVGVEGKPDGIINQRGQNFTLSDNVGSGIANCNVDKDGLCCLMPNYCSKEATCKSDIVGQQTYTDYLNAFPRCQCLPGYTGDGRTKGKGCQNVNECLTGEAKCEQICTDYSPGYACSCNPGYRLNTKDMKTCVDINECEEGIHNCSHICVNTRGSFVCDCPTGYILDKNRQDCVDIDECKENSGLGPCEYGCRNLPGGFECLCPSGYRLDRKTQKCVDIDECMEEKNLCRGFGEVCLNTDGGFECKCGKGYIYDASEKVCKDVNECLLKTHDCANDSVCVNVDGGFTCRCIEKGFKFNEEKRICEDIDECSEGLSNCDQLCFNTLGGYRCGCYKGFRLNISGPENGVDTHSRVCVDIDECLEIPELTGCSHGCINKRGGFQCTCPRGFQLGEDGKSCQDIDECTMPENPCGNNKQFPCCLNIIGGFKCVEQVVIGDIFKRYECPKANVGVQITVFQTNEGNNGAGTNRNSNNHTNIGIFRWFKQNSEISKRLKTK
ncbi:signal peptid and EGF domain-containing protein [Cryptosporidium canis]|uniref:Signal peptid and EGF domain-containing protein n=1 Tax=Cryptosporidium canis TaxID=195482 RepID=A0ABQ8P2X9_9CRYT|nr:signal peptid and EGF domain-containing protein [Cryptosporidium canis]